MQWHFLFGERENLEFGRVRRVEREGAGCERTTASRIESFMSPATAVSGCCRMGDLDGFQVYDSPGTLVFEESCIAKAIGPSHCRPPSLLRPIGCCL